MKRRDRLPRERVGRRATFTLWWSAVSVLAGVTGWLLFSAPDGGHLVVSGDLLGWDAALAVFSGFIVGAVQVAVLTAHGVAGEQTATRYWIGVTLGWAALWPTWLVASPAHAIGYGSAFILLWRALPWLFFGTVSAAWLLVPARRSPHTPPDGGTTRQPRASLGQVEAASGEASSTRIALHSAVAASDRPEAA